MLALLLSAVLMAPRVVEVKLGPKQFEIVREIRQPKHRFFDVEGALRSAKTWSILIGLRTVLEERPAIRIVLSRWNENALHQKLLPDYRNVCALMGLPHGEWNSRESAYDLANGSRAYAVHLKTAQTDNQFATVRGLTAAVFYINQLEEVKPAVYQEAALRISQPGFPQQMIVDPNAVPHSHWIAKQWPVDNSRAQHRYLRLAMRDNAHNLDAATIEAAELLYPIGHPLRGIKIEGRRGLDVSGTPVYAGAFIRSRHVAAESIALNPQLALCEAYDYGFHHPCVVWYQYAPWGHLRMLGGVMGEDLHLDAFLPIVERYRTQWFPDRRALDATCDPAGANENAQGLRGTPVGMLRDWYRTNGDRNSKGDVVFPLYRPDANVPERRYAANQLAATYMRRQVNGAEAFLVDPDRWMLVSATEERADSFFIDGLEAGYVLEDEPRHSSRLGTYTVPKKDGWFEHPMNCFEYGLQAHVLDLPLPGERAAKAVLQHGEQQERARLRALRESQKDVDPDDLPRAGRVVYAKRSSVRRGGY